MNERRNGMGPVDDLDEEARRRAEQSGQRWADTEAALRARWEQREAAFRDEGTDQPPPEQRFPDLGRRDVEAARTEQIRRQQELQQRLDRLSEMTRDMRQRGDVEPRQRLRDRLRRWWAGLLRRRE